MFELSHELSENINNEFGQSFTQTCGVGHPLIGTRGEIHFCKSKKNKNGLSTTSLSIPHRNPCESLGTSSLSKSPFEIAMFIDKDTNINKKYIFF